MCSETPPSLSHRLKRRLQAAGLPESEVVNIHPPTIPPHLDAVALPSPSPRRWLVEALQSRGFDAQSAAFLARTYDPQNRLGQAKAELYADQITSDAAKYADEILSEADGMAFGEADLEALAFEPSPDATCPCEICNIFSKDPFRYDDVA